MLSDFVAATLRLRNLHDLIKNVEKCRLELSATMAY